MRLADCSFELKYKKGKINTQADVLSILATTDEKISHKDDGEITVFDLDMVNDELELNKNPNKVDFIVVQYADMDELYATMDDLAPPSLNFEPIKHDELVST